MKKLLIVLLLLIIPTISFALGGSINMMAGYDATGGAPSYLLSESFDGSTLCATTYTSNCDNTWTVVAGTPSFQGAGIEGTYSLSLAALTDSSSKQVTKSISATSGTYLYFKLKITNSGSTNYLNSTAVFMTAGGTASCILYLNQTAATTFKLRVEPTGGTYATTVGILTTNTVYHIWAYYLPGSGANSWGWVAFSEDGIKPTSGDNYAESTHNGTGTLATGNINLRCFYNGVNQGADVSIDHVRTDNVEIGDNPS